MENLREIDPLRAWCYTHLLLDKKQDARPHCVGTPRAQDKQDDSFGSLRELLRKINQYHLAEQLAKRAKKIILPILQPGGAPTQWGPGILFIMFFGQVKDVCNIML